MRILIDIMHIPHINFFKNCLYQLKEEGNEITILCLDRGRNVSILKKELSEFEIVPIGVHKGTVSSIIFQANIIRFFKVYWFLLGRRYDIGLSVGGFLTGFALKLFNKPNLQFYDDPENKKNVFLQKLTATKLFYPVFFKAKNIRNFTALKEWAYLSPKYFTPNQDICRDYDVEAKKYIFVREVNAGTTNYIGQAANSIAEIGKMFPEDIKVILSLENKDQKHLYPENWILLQEPVEDIHSLMYYSRVLISSGDSMAREGAMLGVPSIYCGQRVMAANGFMAKKGLLFKVQVDEVPNFIKELMSNTEFLNNQESFRQRLFDEWDDVSDFIISEVNNFKK